jgi:transcriptional regulator with XRE-family HTH domain
MNRAELADFLRRRRESLHPGYVSLPTGTLRPGTRRRTPGLRREEVAQLAGMSTDYYGRLEQARGPQPSKQVLASLARALRLTRDERDHMFYLAGHTPPAGHAGGGHVRPGLLHLLDRLTDTPAEVITDLGQILAQNPMAVALLGDQTGYRGLARSFIYRWFTDDTARSIYPQADHGHHTQVQVADLRAAVAKRPGDPEAAALIAALQRESPEFRAVWEQHEVAVRRWDRKRIVHPALGILEVDCEVLLSEEQDQRLLVFSAPPGSPAVEQLEFLAVIGTQ